MPRFAKPILSFAAVFAVYLAAARIGLLFATLNANASPIWPATGAAIILLLIFGFRYWPAIALAAFTANHFTGSPDFVNLLISLGNSGEAVTGAWLYQRVQRQKSGFMFQRNMLAIVCASIFASMVSALFGNLALLGTGVLTSAAFASSLLTWWIGDLLGAFLLLPLYLSWPGMKASLTAGKQAFSRGGHAFFILPLTLAAAAIFYTQEATATLFCFFPLLLVAQFAYGAHTTAWSADLISVAGIVATTHGHGPFSSGNLNSSLLLLQLFLSSLLLSGMALPEILRTKRPRIPIILLLSGWAFSALIFQNFLATQTDANQQRFQTLIHSTEFAIQRRMIAYEEALRAGASLFLSSDYVSSMEWSTFARNLELSKRYPGVHGIGVIVPVAADKSEAFQAEFRKKEDPDFQIHNIGSAPDVAEWPERFLVTYVEPRDSNKKAIGLDMTSEKRRREATLKARESGLATLSDSITLVQDQKQGPGMLFFMPFFDKSKSGEGFRGWVFAPIISEEFFSSLLTDEAMSRELSFRVSDNSTRLPSLLFKSRAEDQDYETTTELVIAQKTLTFSWKRAAAFEQSSESFGAWVSFAAAMAVLLLVGFVSSLQALGERAEEMAEEKSRKLLALEDSDYRYKALVKGMMDYAVYLLDLSGRVTTWNEGARRFKGYADQEILGQSFAIFFKSEDREAGKPQELLRRALEEGRAEDEGWRLRKDGSTFWANVVITRVDDEQGRAMGFSKIVRDMTDRMHREKALQDSLLHLTLACRAGKIGFFTFDRVLGKTVYTREFREILPLAFTGEREHDAASFMTAMAPQHMAHYTEVRTRFMEGVSENAELEYLMNLPGGRKIWLKTYLHAVQRDAEGKPSLVIGYSQDISDAKAVLERVEKSERQLSNALEGSNDGFWDWDLMKAMLSLDARSAKELDLPQQVDMRSPQNFWALAHPADRKDLEGALHAHLSGQSPFFETQARFCRTDGQWKWLMIRGKVSERSATQAASRMSGILIDIHALKEAELRLKMSELELQNINEKLRNQEEQLMKQNKELVLATSAKSNFLATMSHEIRTPLNGIIGIADVLQESALTIDQKNLVQTIQRSGLSLMTIINDILDFSKVEAGKMQFERLSFSLQELVEVQVDIVKSRAREKQLEVKSLLDAELAPNYWGDPGRIGQILLNYLSNAIKFTEKGGVELSARKDKDLASGATSIVFAVKDSGIGLKEDQVEKMFQSFTQADSSTSRKYGGTGLGLSICKKMAEAMGGEVGVHSKLGEGSEFWLRIPLEQDKNVLALPTERKNLETAAGAGSEGEKTATPALDMHILVAEDNQVNQMLIKRLLDGLGCSCLVVNNGKEALDALRDFRFDLVLMDCQMPEMDGYEATWRIRNQLNSEIMIVALTANAMDGDEQRCREAGMNDYLSKPIRKETLRTKLQTLQKALRAS